MSLLDLASLVLAPTATKEGKVYSAIPDTGDGDMTFTRASAATRINSAGLIEKERGNLLLQSNTFDTTWSTSNASVTSGQSGYDGSSDAWLLTKTAASGAILQSISTSGLKSFSVYMKANESDWGLLQCVGGGNPYAYFNLDTGVVGSKGGGAIESTIENIGSGWYRCTLVFNASISNTRIYPSEANSPSATSGSIYIQDAMLNEGLVAQSYIPTTTSAVYEGITDDVPRVDYSGGGCPSLLLESQRTNNIPQSEYFGSGSGWSYINNVSVGNFVLSPEGKMNATELIFDGTANGRIERTISGLTSGANYSVSLYARVASGTQNVFFGSYQSAVFTLTTEWQRLERTQPENDTDAYPRIGCDDAATIEIWGFQHEAGSYPTSYIPTYSVSSTRVADSCSKTGISELIGQTEGTLFVEVDLSKVPSENRRFLAIGDGTVSNRIGIGQQSGTSLESFVVASGSLQAIFTQSGTTAQVYKIAIAYASNDFVMYVDGSQVGTDTSGSVPSTSNVYVGVSEITPTTTQVSDGITQAILFPTRLTNDQLEELTK